MDTTAAPLISLIHPSLGRPSQSYETIYRWLQCAIGTPIEIIVALNSDDVMLPQYQKLYQSQQHPNVRLLILDFASSVEAINTAAKLAKANIMIVVSDDTYCPDSWAAQVLKATEGLQDFVLKVDDGLQKRLITMPILDKAYYRRTNHIYYPKYQHLFCDTDFSERAYRLKRVRIRHNLKFNHLQYSILNKPPDTTALRNESTYHEGKALYKLRERQNFGIS